VGKFLFNFIIKDMNNVLKNNNEQMQVDSTVFKYSPGQKHSASIIVDSEDQTEALKVAKHLANISLSKVCFCYASEAQICDEGYSITDLSIDPFRPRVSTSITIAYSTLGWEPAELLNRIGSLPQERMNVVDLALLYLKLSSRRNPLRIESLFSSMTVIIRDLYPDKIGNKYDPEHVATSLLKNGIKEILKCNVGFDEMQFDKQWTECYLDERCSIAHGKKSTILDISRKYESEELVRDVYNWAANLILFYINKFAQKTPMDRTN